MQVHRCMYFFSFLNPWGLASLLVAVLMGLVGCSTSQTPRNDLMHERQAKSTPAAAGYAASNFFVDVERPEKEATPQIFFYQKCDPISRRRYPSKVEYDCNSSPF